MASVRENIINNLMTELYFINNDHNYSSLVKKVYYGFMEIEDIHEFPSVSFYLGTDIIIDPLEAGINIMQTDIEILGYVDAKEDPEHKGLLAIKQERLINDFHKFFLRYKSVPKDKVSSLINLENVLKVEIVEIKSPIDARFNRDVCGILLKVNYLQDPLNIEQENVSAVGNSAEV